MVGKMKAKKIPTYFGGGDYNVFNTTNIYCLTLKVNSLSLKYPF
jgi:hypothetical protein